jgi:LPXTG-site transpeptidase (sortase) family protein
MSESTVARFPQASLPHHNDNDPHGAEHARKRIAELPDPYLAHATPRKEALVGRVDPVSPAAEAALAAHGEEASAPEMPEMPAETAEARVVTHGDASPLQTTPLNTTADETNATTTANLPGSAVPIPPQSLPSRLRPLMVGIATFVGLFIVFKAPIFLSQLNYLTQPKVATSTATQASVSVPAAPTISIPKINVNAPVVYATDNNENDILTDLESGVVHYANTALPGQPGNSVIFGHSSNDWWEAGNYKFVFVLLDKLQTGDTFTVNYDSHQYIYQVTGSQVVEPTDLSVLNQTTTPTMTLITCTPPGTSWKRLVVSAKQISPVPTTTTATAAATTTTKATSAGSSLPSNSPSLTQQIGSWWHGLTNFVTGKKAAPAKSAAPSTPGGTLPAT